LLGQWDTIVLRDKILYRRFENGSEEIDQMIVPSRLRQSVLKELHSGIGGGHLGTKKMLKKVKSRFYWPGWTQDVEIYCQECTICSSRRNPAVKQRAPLVPIRTGAPLEKITMDILGPLPKSNRGNYYILVISDYFSKWTEAYAIRNHKAKTIARKLVEEFICRFGAPYTIHTDQGRDFESNLKEISTLFDSKKQRTTAYHPKSDGQVERFNKTLIGMLSKHVDENQKNWDEQIPFVMLAYRSSINETTGFSPSMLMFGHEIRLPLDVVLGTCPQQEQEKTQYVSSLRRNLETAFQRVRTNITTSQRRQKDYYDRKVSGKQIDVGNKVMLFNPSVKPGLSQKLHCPWEKEPYTVIQKISEVDYKIRKGNAKPKIVHFNRLKTFVEPKGEGEMIDLFDRIGQNRIHHDRRCLNGGNERGEQQLTAPLEQNALDVDLSDESDNENEEVNRAQFEVDDPQDVERDAETESEDNIDDVDEDEMELPVRPRRARGRPKYLEDYET